MVGRLNFVLMYGNQTVLFLQRCDTANVGSPSSWCPGPWCRWNIQQLILILLIRDGDDQGQGIQLEFEIPEGALMIYAIKIGGLDGRVERNKLHTQSYIFSQQPRKTPTIPLRFPHSRLFVFAQPTPHFLVLLSLSAPSKQPSSQYSEVTISRLP
jgi:hypothetical protein